MVGGRFGDGALVPENEIVEMSGSLVYTADLERGMFPSADQRP